MTMHHHYLRPLAASLLFAASLSAAHAYSLYPERVGNVTYLTGGIGDEERNAMKSVSNDYNLSVMSATRSGAFVGDTQVRISDRQGRELVETTAGPLFYAALPPGRYVVEAESRGQTHRQNITIDRGQPAHIHFSWK